MKKYKVVQPVVIRIDGMGIEEEIEVYEALDLVNINDSSDKIMAAPDEFFVGSIISEDEFYMDSHSYIDEQGNLGTADFAFKKGN